MATKLTNGAVAKLIDGIYGTSITAPTYIGWGTGSTAAAVTDTALQTASAEARTNGTKSKVTTTVANDTLQVVGTITSLGSQTISEAGLFDASTVGNMYVHGVFTGIALGVGDSIAFTVTIQVTTS
jgi:hypothetical protein